jgi:hypothetical protein
VAIPQNVGSIHSIIVDDRRVSAKKITKALPKSSERGGQHYPRDFTYEELSAKWVAKPLNAVEQRVIECLLHKPFWTDFGGNLMVS